MGDFSRKLKLSYVQSSKGINKLINIDKVKKSFKLLQLTWDNFTQMFLLNFLFTKETWKRNVHAFWLSAKKKKKKKVKQLFSTLIILRKQPIRVISERSCDTEDWRNDAENSALLQNKIYWNRKQSFWTQTFDCVNLSIPLCRNKL